MRSSPGLRIRLHFRGRVDFAARVSPLRRTIAPPTERTCGRARGSGRPTLGASFTGRRSSGPSDPGARIVAEGSRDQAGLGHESDRGTSVDLYEKAAARALLEGKSVSQLAREALEKFVR